MNAAVWFGGALFYTCAIAPAFFAPEMEKLFGEVYTGVIALVMWDRYYALFYWCGVIAVVHQLAEWVYLGRALQRLTLGLWVAVFLYALIGGLWLQPKLKQLHQVKYAREGVYAEAVQSQAARSYVLWRRTGQAANILALMALLTYVWRTNNPPAGPRFLSSGKFRS